MQLDVEVDLRGLREVGKNGDLGQFFFGEKHIVKVEGCKENRNQFILRILCNII